MRLRQFLRGSFLTAAILGAAAFSSACFSTAPDEKALKDQEDIRKQEKEFSKEMLEAFIKDKPGTFLPMLSGEAKEKFGEKEFRVTRKQITEAMGKPTGYEFLTTLNAPGFRSYLWKVTFERTGTLDREKDLKQETLFRVVMITPKSGSKPYVLSFGFL